MTGTTMKNMLWIGMLALSALSASPTVGFGQSIYWVDAGFLSPALGRADFAGGNATTIPLRTKSLPEGLALDAIHNRVYLSELAFANARISRTTMGLTSFGSIDSVESALRGIAVDPVKGKLYWTSSNLTVGAKIVKANLDGSAKQILYSFPPRANANPRGIALLDSNLYWADFSSGKIQVGDTGGISAARDFMSNLNGPVGVAIGNDGYIYWCEAVANVIKRRTILPGIAAILLSGLASPQYLAIDAASGQLFWTEIGVPRIRKANLNGSNVQTLPISVAHPTGIAAGTQLTSVSEAKPLPREFALNQNFPNPFNPSTTLSYDIPIATVVRVSVLDILGREVALVVEEPQDPGSYKVTFNATRLASGVYFCRLQAAGTALTRRLLLVR
jgi:hypothetical protein